MRPFDALSAICILISSGLALTPRFDPAGTYRQASSSNSKPPSASCDQLPDSDGFLVDTSGVHQECDPAVGFDGTNFLVVWQDFRGSSVGIDAARVTQQGTVLDSAGFVISQMEGNRCYHPAVGFDGTNFLVVWADSRNGNDCDVYGARVTPQGTVLDPAGFVISQATKDQNTPAVGFNGASFLVSWGDFRRGGPFGDIYGARVTPAGVVLDPEGIPISAQADDQAYPSVSSDGANFLVVWEDDRTDWTTYGTRVTPQAAVLDSAGFAISLATSAYFPALSFDGANFLVVWSHLRNGSNSDIRGARATPGGTVLDSADIVISRSAYEQRWPAIGYDGANFLVVWQFARSEDDVDIHGARVTPAGVVFDSGPVVRQEGNQACPKLCHGSGSQMFLAYQGWAGNVGGKDYNTYRIWGKMNPLPSNREPVVVEGPITTLGASIVRGLLHMPERPSSNRLLDVCGRKVMDVRPGANDVSRLSPGVYFIRQNGVRPGTYARKVVITD